MTDARQATVDAGQHSGRSGLSRLAWWLLIVSLALNLLVIGAFAGAAILHKRGHREPVFGGASLSPGELFGYVRTLPGERRRAIRQIVSGERPKLEAARTTVNTARDEVGRLLSAEPLDKAALAAGTAKLWSAEGNLRQLQFDIMAAMAGVMTQDERVRFVEWRKTRWMRPGGPGRRGSDTGDDNGADRGGGRPE